MERQGFLVAISEAVSFGHFQPRGRPPLSFLLLLATPWPVSRYHPSDLPRSYHQATKATALALLVQCWPPKPPQAELVPLVAVIPVWPLQLRFEW